MSNVILVGVLGLVAVVACWALALVLFRVSAAGSVGRKLAVLLVVEGVVLATAEFPEMAFNISDSFYESNPQVYAFLGLVHHLADAVMIALYPPFLAQALNTSVTRIFASKKVKIGLAVGAVALGFAVTLFPSRVLITLFYSIVTLVFIYALIASLHAWRTAESEVVRERAGIFALAFGLRDLGWVLSYGISAWLIWVDPAASAAGDSFLLQKSVYALGTLFAVPLIAYGILKAKLFDIDLRIRWTIKQTTLAGIFVALMFLISEAASTFLSAELGNVAGLLAAAVVMFFLAPLQRFADGVAGAAMPNTANTPEYLSYRKLRVYEAALTEALQEGGISDRERSLLNYLRDSLEISPVDAEALEQELQAGRAGL